MPPSSQPKIWARRMQQLVALIERNSYICKPATFILGKPKCYTKSLLAVVLVGAPFPCVDGISLYVNSILPLPAFVTTLGSYLSAFAFGGRNFAYFGFLGYLKWGLSKIIFSVTQGRPTWWSWRRMVSTWETTLRVIKWRVSHCSYAGSTLQGVPCFLCHEFSIILHKFVTYIGKGAHP